MNQDESNQELEYLWDLVTHTDELIYLTGKAGTGKTTFLKALKKKSDKNTVVVAPTGVAAINAGGQTIHSFFQIKPSIYVPNDKRLRTRLWAGDDDKTLIFDHFKYHKQRLSLIRNMERLIIDEISMVRADLLDVIDKLLRVFRRRPYEVFGGVQVILIGDPFQLPPIAKPDEWRILSEHYESPFFFDSNVIQEQKPIYIELKKIYRQTDDTFISLLNRIRTNSLFPEDIEELNERYEPHFDGGNSYQYITLATHNKIVDQTNFNKLNALPGEVRVFNAEVKGRFPERAGPADQHLQLKIGAQVMFIRNDKKKRFYNGKIGRLKAVKEEGLVVEIANEEQDIFVEKEQWDNIAYRWNAEQRKVDEEILGSFTQYPLKLAWAVTVHKSQGLTFEHVIADLGGAFASGQVYVALSRCTSFNGLILKSRLNNRAIMVNPRVVEFANAESSEIAIEKAIEAGKSNKLYKEAKHFAIQGKIAQALSSLSEAIAIRDEIDGSTFQKCLSIVQRRYFPEASISDMILDAYETIKTEDGKLSDDLRKLITRLLN